MPDKLKIQVEVMEKSVNKFSGTEGYFGLGEFSNNSEYPLYNSEQFIEILKENIKNKILKKGNFPEVWDESFLDVHNCIILSSVMVEKIYF